MNKHLVVFFFPALLGSALFAQENSGKISIIVKPAVVYYETDGQNNYLNFDFLVDNNSGQNMVLNAIEMVALDANNKVEKRDFVNLYSRSSLELPTDKPILPGQAKMIFNPFPVFEKAVTLKKLHYEFSFCTEDVKEHEIISVDVYPRFYQTKTNLILPVKGKVLVWDGHEYNSHHRRFDYTDSLFIRRGTTMNFQRYGYDFVIVDEKGTMYTGPSKINMEWYDDVADANSDYLGFGVPIYATGSGTVVDVRDSVDDNRMVKEEDILRNEKAYGGNYIIIDHGNGEFSWFGHLERESIRVKKGQQVKQGQVIAAMGASGNSLFPHLHYELRNGDGAKHVEGLPSYFSNYTRVLGSKKIPVKKGLLNTGEILEVK